MKGKTKNIGKYKRTKKIRARTKYNIFKYNKLRAQKLIIKYTKLLNQIPDNFFAWFTGFWEGEGTLSTTNYNKYLRVSLSITQNEKFVLKFIKTTLKHGCLYNHSTPNCFIWKTGSRPFLSVLITKMIPYIHCQKRIRQIRKAEKCLKKLY